MKLEDIEKIAICLWCGGVVGVKRDNTLKSHRCAGGGKCAGSNKKYEAEIPAPKKKKK